MDRLQELGKFAEQLRLKEKGIDIRGDWADYQMEDKGTWLDAIKDVVQIGDTVGDTISKFWD